MELLKENKSEDGVKEMFLKKCKSKKIEFTGIEQFFPDGIEDVLKKYLPQLTRLTNESVKINKMLSETREMIKNVI